MFAIPANTQPTAAIISLVSNYFFADSSAAIADDSFARLLIPIMF